MLCRLAVCPTSTSPLSVKATIEGVVRPPSEFSMTFASPPSITATHELVVPRSMPIALAIIVLLQVVPCMDGTSLPLVACQIDIAQALRERAPRGRRDRSTSPLAAGSRGLLVLALCLVLALAQFLVLALVL